RRCPRLSKCGDSSASPGSLAPWSDHPLMPRLRGRPSEVQACSWPALLVAVTRAVGARRSWSQRSGCTPTEGGQHGEDPKVPGSPLARIALGEGPVNAGLSRRHLEL